MSWPFRALKEEVSRFEVFDSGANCGPRVAGIGKHALAVALERPFEEPVCFSNLIHHEVGGLCCRFDNGEIWIVHVHGPSRVRKAVDPRLFSVLLGRDTIQKQVNKWEQKMPYAKNGDIEIYYEDTGGDLPVIIFSHGLLSMAVRTRANLARASFCGDAARLKAGGGTLFCRKMPG